MRGSSTQLAKAATSEHAHTHEDNQLSKFFLVSIFYYPPWHFHCCYNAATADHCALFFPFDVTSQAEHSRSRCLFILYVMWEFMTILLTLTVKKWSIQRKQNFCEMYVVHLGVKTTFSFYTLILWTCTFSLSF